MAREVKVKSILNMVGKAESDSAGGYNALVGSKKGIEGLTDKTIGEVLKIQQQRIKEGKNSAMGRYQIINNTLKDTYKKAGLTENDKFSPENQDRLGEALLEKRGLAKYLKGEMDSTSFGESLSKEWAGLPVLKDTESKKRGQSYYKGVGNNKATISPNTVEKILSKIIPGAEGSEINEENMAKKRIDKFMVGDKTEETPKVIAPEEDNIFENISKQMSKQIAKGNVSVPTQEDRESVPEKEMPQDAPVNEKDKERKRMDDGFKDALLYFGPRLGALLLGGTDAMELTDKTLKGFDETVGKSREAMLKEGEEKEMTPYQKSRIKIQEEKFRREDEALAREQEGIAIKEDKTLLQSIEAAEQTLDEFAQIDTALQGDEGIVGAWDYYVKGTREDKMPGQSDYAAKRSNIRRMMEQLKVDEGLANTAKTKGAISDLEFKILMKPAPTMTDQEKGWREWIAKRARILSKMHTNLKKELKAPLEDNKSRQRIESYKRSIDEDRVPQKEQEDNPYIRMSNKLKNIK